jgi:YHS domain-containing protein
MRVFVSRLAIVSALLGACDSKPAGPAAGHAAGDAHPAPVAAANAERQTAALTRVSETSKVCMVTDQYMGTEQIPVAVDGKAYFGCCPMCKDRLERDLAVRSAKDPVTGRIVDKAVAVIGKTDTGKLLYFENLESFQRYGGT